MKRISLVTYLLLFPVLLFAQKYPVTKSEDNKVSKFNISYPDNYSWLENMDSDEVKNWANAQNETTNLHFEEVKKEYDIVRKINEYDAFASNSLPTKKEAYFYTRYIVEKGKPTVLFYRKELNDQAIELFNPFKIYRNTTATLMNYNPSKNSKYMACEVSTDGSDKHEIRFVPFDKANAVDDIIKNIKFSRMSWNKDDGIFYMRNRNQNTFAKDSTYQLYYHKIGTIQENDKLVFDATKTGNHFTYFIKKDRLIIIESDCKNPNKNYYSASLNEEEYHLQKFLELDDTMFTFLNYNNNKVYFSGKEYDWGEIRAFDLSNKNEETVFIPQIYNNLLVDAVFTEGYIFCKYKTKNKYYVIAYDETGKFVRKFDSPEGTTFDIKFYDPKSNSLYISVYSYTVAPQNFKLNIESGEVRNFYNDYIVPKGTLFSLDHFITKSIDVKSRDNKDIPITILYKKGTELNGNNPTLLQAYGGFGVVSEPNYDSALMYFLEKGGVFCFAEIRGGGEKGLKWHKEAMRLKKMNSFNDFIDVAEYLIKEKYTSSQKLAISGGSYGGLVVGVAMTQRPDLFKVVIPKVGVFDMLKFDQYTVGRYHLDEFGNPETKTDFENLYSYSPYHNIKENVNYPITLIITSKNDDRVPPFHSYKFAARLQNRTAQKNPVSLETRDDSGHYGKISTYKSYQEDKADFYDFLLYHLNK
ncbi:prolyl oligopeptidase family serine peptidase [Flavobacterium sp. N1994]|uniref:prolyl oligopeptidase family serine peptidase n=1 Tax=Flavobacterium sp. N1994 TaxID=2986827 RepID=UPI002223B1CD|nr:prolyl oligopeptidase family serine peptidase [Flavobacterium sp. N1994]